MFGKDKKSRWKPVGPIQLMSGKGNWEVVILGGRMVGKSSRLPGEEGDVARGDEGERSRRDGRHYTGKITRNRKSDKCYLILVKSSSWLFEEKKAKT